MKSKRKLGNDCLSEVTVERLERALAICAYCVVLDGPAVLPLFERVERPSTED